MIIAAWTNRPIGRSSQKLDTEKGRKESRDCFVASRRIGSGLNRTAFWPVDRDASQKISSPCLSFLGVEFLEEAAGWTKLHIEGDGPFRCVRDAIRAEART
jgi:hypothetical protein